MRPGGVLGALSILGVACVTPGPSVETQAAGAPAAVPAPATEARLDAEAVRQVVAAGERRVEACYQAELDRLAEAPDGPVPAPAGRMLVRFDVSEDGTVADPEVVDSDVTSDAVLDCVLAEVARWRFPRPSPGEAPVGVEVPFRFVPTAD